MKKPSNYDAINVGGWTPITEGGHKCIIKKVEETKSKNGFEMIVVSFDTTNDDTQPAYFANQYLSDKEAKRDNLAWRGVQYIVTDEQTEYGSANLKRFVTAVEASNEGFEVQWGEQFAPCLKNKNVGVVFRKEEYIKNDGSVGTNNKPFRFCNYNEAFEQTVPDIKKIQQTESAPTYTPSADPMLASEGFMQINDDLTDEGLPFH